MMKGSVATLLNRDEMVERFQTAADFTNFIDTLFLTDRQKKIAHFKYLRGWANIDIAEELEISRRTVTEELKEIRKIIGKA